MKPHIANLLNAATLIVMGLWGYFGSESSSPTALIPVVFGAVLILMNNGVKNENKVIAHIAVVITLLMIIALIMPLRGSIARGNTEGIIRTILMMATGVIAMISFIGSFRAARKARESGE